MGKVYTTVDYGHGKVDLALPDDVPVQFLAEGICQAMKVSFPEDQLLSLGLVNEDGIRRLSPAVSLSLARVRSGTVLKLVGEALPTTQGAYLVSANGLKFLLKNENILGRQDSSGSVKIDIDLSHLAVEPNLISRRHAIIKFQAGHFVLVDQNSRNGSWVKGQQVKFGAEYALQKGDVLDFGKPGQGARLTFQSS